MSKKKAMFFKSVSGGGFPVVEDFTTQFQIGGISSFTLSKPTGVVSGDLLLILLTTADTSTSAYDGTTYNPRLVSDGTDAGFTLISTFADGNSAGFASYYKVADGLEESTIDVVSNNAGSLLDACGAYIRVSGTNTTTPKDITGIKGGSVASSVDIPSITTTNNNALAIALLSTDGDDLKPFTVDGNGIVGETGTNGWIYLTLLSTGTASSSQNGGIIAYKEMASAGATGVCNVAASASDGLAGFQFSINPL